MAPRIDHQRLDRDRENRRQACARQRRPGRRDRINAKHDLHRTRIILRAKAGQIGIEIRLRAVQRLENGDGRAIASRRASPCGQSRARPMPQKAHSRSRARPPHSRRPTPKRRILAKNSLHTDPCGPRRTGLQLYGPTAVHARLNQRQNPGRVASADCFPTVAICRWDKSASLRALAIRPRPECPGSGRELA